MKRLFIIATLLLSLSPLSSGVVFAQDQVATDFETRREVLMKVFELSKSEILDLQSRLDRMGKPEDETSAVVYSALSRNLESYLGLVESRIKELSSSALTLDGVRITADNFKQWRETVYDPSTRELFDFLILSQGDAIFSIVETRYTNVVSDVERLRLSFAPEVMVQLDEMLQLAEGRLANARLLRDAANDLFIENFKMRHSDLAAKFAKADAGEAVNLTASAVDAVAPQPAAPQTIIDTLDMTQETVQSLTKRAIDEISETYKLFLSMRELVRSQ